MTISERARVLIAESGFDISVSTVVRRIRGGWSDEKILTTRPQRKPPNSHPLKSPCWRNVAKRKGWKLDEEA
jgi:hypothetical protein